MNVATMLLIVLSHQGYWFGGQEQTVSVAWPVDAKMPAAGLQWELKFGAIRLAGETVRMPTGNDSAVVKMKVPTVRVRTEMHWVYRVIANDGGKDLVSGERVVHLFPPSSLGDLASRTAGRRLFVVDQPDALPSLLIAAKIDSTCVAGVEDLQSVTADLVLVAPNRITDSPFGQSPLLSQARSGAQILVLEQSQTRTLGGYPLSPRPVPPCFSWREDHPLFWGLDKDDLASWLRGNSNHLWAIRLPTDEPALELAYWPRESPGKDPAPIDALAVVKAVGKGRIVFCQIPLGDWKDDPRSALFLENALNYLLTRPEPTPRPSERSSAQATPAAALIGPTTIDVPSGDQP